MFVQQWLVSCDKWHCHEVLGSSYGSTSWPLGPRFVRLCCCPPWLSEGLRGREAACVAGLNLRATICDCGGVALRSLAAVCASGEAAGGGGSSLRRAPFPSDAFMLWPFSGSQGSHPRSHLENRSRVPGLPPQCGVTQKSPSSLSSVTGFRSVEPAVGHRAFPWTHELLFHKP